MDLILDGILPGCRDPEVVSNGKKSHGPSGLICETAPLVVRIYVSGKNISLKEDSQGYQDSKGND